MFLFLLPLLAGAVLLSAWVALRAKTQADRTQGWEILAGAILLFLLAFAMWTHEG